MFTSALPISARADSDVITFTFSETGITASKESASAYSIEGNSLTIKQKGAYRVTGSCSDGSVKVKKGTTGVTLTLADLTLANTTTAPLMCNKNSQVDIIVEGTVSLEDSEKNAESYWTDIQHDNSDTDVTSDLDNAENAVVKFKGASKVTVSGDGELNITAHAKNGIKSGSTLDTDLETELAENSESDYYASLTMSDLTLNITANDVYVPKYESSDSDTDTPNNPFDPRGGGRPGGGGFGGPQDNEEETYGDGINAESTLNLVSGTYNINAGDDGLHCDYTMNLGKKGADNGALDININESYEGIEAATLNFYSGDIDITASDDAVNAANGDLNNYSFSLNVYGGDIYADASVGNDNDAIDSNGTINIYGGKVIALTNSGGNAIDADGNITFYGGTVLGLGGSNMAESPSNQSTQSYAVWTGSANGGGRFGGWGGFGGMGGGSSATNISDTDKSRVKLVVGETEYSIGSSISNINANTNVSVIIDGEREVISTTAKAAANYVIFAGSLDEEDSDTATDEEMDTSSEIESDTASDTNTDTSSDTESESDTEDEAEPYTAAFEITGGQGTITTYTTQDYTSGEENQTTADVRDKLGNIDTTGEGQVNFTVVPADGYEIESVTAAPTTAYKNLKTPKDTGAVNTYRITKITGDITVTVTLHEIASSTESEVDTSTESEADTDTESDTETEEKALFGDVNLDGKIYSDDALMALNHSSALELLEGLPLALGDVNKDGVVDSHDALLILRCSAGFRDDDSLAGTETLVKDLYK